MWTAADEVPHMDVAVEEWLIAAWTPAVDLGLIHGFRRFPSQRRGWQWSALARAGQPLLHVGEWDVPLRAAPMVAKASQLWGEWICDAPFEQWTVGMETYAAALDDPGDAVGRAYGTLTPIAWDLEWYAVASPEPVEGGYGQQGVIHGLVELREGPLSLTEVPSWRWHRWGDALGPVALEEVSAHVGLRAPFAFPDGTIADWVLTGAGWRRRGTISPVAETPVR
jgi:hypothetical protein